MKYGYEELNSISTMRITNDIESKWESAHTQTDTCNQHSNLVNSETDWVIISTCLRSSNTTTTHTINYVYTRSGMNAKTKFIRNTSNNRNKPQWTVGQESGTHRDRNVIIGEHAFDT